MECQKTGLSVCCYTCTLRTTEEITHKVGKASTLFTSEYRRVGVHLKRVHRNTHIQWLHESLLNSFKDTFPSIQTFISKSKWVEDKPSACSSNWTTVTQERSLWSAGLQSRGVRTWASLRSDSGRPVRPVSPASTATPLCTAYWSFSVVTAARSPAQCSVSAAWGKGR